MIQCWRQQLCRNVLVGRQVFGLTRSAPVLCDACLCYVCMHHLVHNCHPAMTAPSTPGYKSNKSISNFSVLRRETGPPAASRIHGHLQPSHLYQYLWTLLQRSAARRVEKLAADDTALLQLVQAGAADKLLSMLKPTADEGERFETYTGIGSLFMIWPHRVSEQSWHTT